MPLGWQLKGFSQLTTQQLYDILKLRTDVFVVEQCCFYPEIDHFDNHPQTQHLFLYQERMSVKDHTQTLVAYLRILPNGIKYAEKLSLGRVVIHPNERSKGLGKILLTQALNICQQKYPQQAIKISAQQHLKGFYQGFGFKQTSEPYLEDGISHIDMDLAATINKP